MSNTQKPDGATCREHDGTYWKCEKGIWMYWRKGWGWCQYVGNVSQNFLNKFYEI